MSPVYSVEVDFVDETKLGLKLLKTTNAQGEKVIVVMGFNTDDQGNPLQPAATAKVI